MDEQQRVDQLLKEITEAPGVPGFEEEVRAIMRKHMEPVAELDRDNLGSVIGKKRGKADQPRIMLAGHMDEVGFMVTYITDDGFIKFQTLGGWWAQVMLAQRVIVHTRRGPVPGVVGSKPPHLLLPDERKKMVEHKDMFIDIGARDREEAEGFGVRIGDPVVPDSSFRYMANENLLMAKAWDNRIGCAVAIEVLRRLGDVEHPNTVYGVGTVQEEVGLRGAQTTAQYIGPDVGFALEAAIPGDTPGIKPEEAQSELGGGPVILVYDASMIGHRKLRDLVVQVAEDNGIPYQFDAMARGGTDAGRIQLVGRGTPSLVVGVPVRYVHSHTGIIDRRDFNSTVDLMVNVVKALDAAAVEELRS